MTSAHQLQFQPKERHYDTKLNIFLAPRGALNVSVALINLILPFSIWTPFVYICVYLSKMLRYLYISVKVLRYLQLSDRPRVASFPYFLQLSLHLVCFKFLQIRLKWAKGHQICQVGYNLRQIDPKWDKSGTF